MKIISINIGQIALHKDPFSPRKAYPSAIHKLPVSTLEKSKPISASFLGLEGDQQADQRVHGGSDKAIYAYPSEHYSFWTNQLLAQSTHQIQEPIEYGFLGENLTVLGLLEHDVWVGDLWFIGDLELRVTKLREPCFKFNAKMDDPEAGKTMLQTAKSGWYLRVLKEGMIKAGDTIKVVPGPRKLSIKHQNDALLKKRA